MKRVALFPSAFHPMVGGVEELSRQLALQIQGAGGAALVCTNRWPRNLPERERIGGVEVQRYAFRLPSGGWKARVSFELTGSRVLEELCRSLAEFRAEVVHVQCVSSNAWYAQEAARRLRIPLVLSVQGERTMDAQGVYQTSPLFNRVLRSAVEAADRITACSQATLMDLQRYWGAPFGSRASVVYNGIGPEAFFDGPGWAHPRPYLLGIGRLVPQKGFANLIEAYRSSDLRGIDLLIAGEGPERRSLESLAEKMNLGGRVHFVGRAQREMVHSLHRAALGLVVPSLREPMGIVALEGMAAGKPLVVSNVDGLAEIGRQSSWCRMVAPGDREALSEALAWIAQAASGAGAAQARGQREVARRFLWNRIAAEYGALYEEVYEERRASAVEPGGVSCVF